MKLIIFVLCAFIFSCCFAQQCTDVPVAKCKPNPPIYELPLDENGKYYFNTTDINNGSSTTCPPLTLNLRNAPVNNTITCNSVDLIPPYPLTIFLLASSAGSSQASVCFTRYEVVDKIPPKAICKPVTVGSNAVISADLIDGGSSDNCGIKNRIANVTSVGACDQTNITVSLTVTDYSGNVAKCTTFINVADSVAPEAKCKNSTQNVGMTGIVTILQTQGSIINDGSVDFCDGTNLTLSLALNGTDTNITRTCSSLGTVNVGLNAVDSNGNVGTCKANIYFQDLTPPTAVCKNNVTINVGETGTYNLTAYSITANSSDVCGVTSYGDDVIFTCNELYRRGWYWYPDGYDGYDGYGGYGTPVKRENEDRTTRYWKYVNEFEDASIYQTFYVTDSSFNQASCETLVLVVDDTPPNAECVGSFTLEVGYNYGYIYPYYLDQGSSDICTYLDYQLDNYQYDCSDVGTYPVYLTVIDQFGNNATCSTPVTFVDTIAPNTYCTSSVVDVGATPSGIYTVHANDTFLINDNSFDYCTSITTSLNIARDLEINCNLLGRRSFTLYAEDAYENVGSCDGYVDFVDNTKPTLVCAATEEVDVGNGRNHFFTSAFLMDGTTDVCGVTYGPIEHLFNCTLGLGTKTVTSTATDPSGNSVSCNTVVTVADLVEPVPECKLTASLNVGATGTVTAVPSDVDAGSYDACTPITRALINSQVTFTCADIDVHDVILQVVDTSRNNATCTAPLRIEDTTAPVAVCKTYVADVGAAPGGFITLNVNDGYLANGGSTDVCTATSDLVYTFATPVTGSCSTLGNRTVTLFVADEYDNQASCQATVTFADLTPPEVACSSLTVINVGHGPVTPILSQIATASDICGPLTYSTLDPTTYNCNGLGDHNFTIRVTDGAGNFANCTTLLRVVDNGPPKAQCTSFTLPVGTGLGVLTPANVNSGSSDLCTATPTLSLDKTNFTCSDVGTRVVTLTAEDASNNTDTCQAVVHVVDTTPPVAVCQNIVVDVGVDGSVTLPTTSGNLVDNGSLDICSSVSLALNQSFTGTCATVGNQVATLIVKDDSGNNGTCTSTISFRDLTPPTVVCRAAVTVNVGTNAYTFDPFLGVLNYFDTCDSPATTFTSNQTAFTCANIGATAVNITVTDPSGNQAFCLSTVIGEDHTGPVAACLSNVVVQVGATGSAIITTANIDNNSADACLGPLTRTINQTLFTCAEVGMVVPVELSLLDQYGNPSSCVGSVTPLDIVPPVALCRDRTVYLGATGTVSVSSDFIDNGSSDICTAQNDLTFAMSQTTFSCANTAAPVTVTLTVTDLSGNPSTCTGRVTVIDAVPPKAKCVNIIQAVAAAVTTGAVNAGSSDACGVVLSLSTTTFTNPIGGVTTLYATDPSGNTDTCASQVTIQFGNALTISAGQPLAVVSQLAEHIPFVVSWVADVAVPTGTLVELGLINSINSFYYQIAKDVQFDRLRYVVQDGISGVTADQDYLVVMYVPGFTNYASRGITLIRYPTNHP